MSGYMNVAKMGEGRYMIVPEEAVDGPQSLHPMVECYVIEPDKDNITEPMPVGSHVSHGNGMWDFYSMAEDRLSPSELLDGMDGELSDTPSTLIPDGIKS